MSIIKCLINLFVLTKIYVISQIDVYETEDYNFFLKLDNLNFEEATSYCKKFQYGEIALVKDRNLADELEPVIVDKTKDIPGK